MTTNDDSFLNSLLQYHTGLVDQQFVDGIIYKIKAKNKFRLKTMVAAMLLAFLLAIPLISNITDDLVIINGFVTLSPYIITFFSISVLGFFAWLTSENF